ncbi:hypothetical protein [Thiomonas sp.]
MSHDCLIRGSIPVRDVSNEKLAAVFDPYLRTKGSSFQQAFANDEIDWREQKLILDLDLSTYGDGGGYSDTALDELAQRLNTIVRGPAWFELVDSDTEGPEEALTPYFLGASDAEITEAQLRYGLEQAKPWLEPILGEKAFQEVAEMILRA